VPSQKSGQSFENIAASYDRWYESPMGKYINPFGGFLGIRLTKP
jgi:hypothetical protein